MTTRAANEIFEKNEIWNYTEDRYGALHTSGDEYILNDIKESLQLRQQRKGCFASDQQAIMTTCANLILTDAIEDFAVENNISISEARHRILSSKACESLYNFDTKLWAEGPDYFRAFYEAVEKNSNKHNGS